MFSAQFGQLANALRAAGLSPDAANQVAAILGNSQQGAALGARSQVDLTPQSMRYVTPDIRRHQLPSLDFRQSDPDFRQLQFRASEERPVVQQAPTVRGDPAPQSTDSTFRVKGGNFLNAKGTGDSVQVDMKIEGTGRGALIDHQSGSIVGKDYRCEADDSGLRFFIEETGTELVWKLMLKEFLARAGEPVDVVTGVALTHEGLTMSLRTVRVLAFEGEERQSVIPTSGC